MFNIFNRLKRKNEAELAAWQRNQEWLSQACRLGVAKMDNPGACSGSFVYNDGSALRMNEPSLQEFIKSHGPNWTMQDWEEHKRSAGGVVTRLHDTQEMPGSIPGPTTPR